MLETSDKICARVGSDLAVTVEGQFDLAATLDCGQAFRWQQTGDKWIGVAHGRVLTLYQDGNRLVLENSDEAEFDSVWREYFDLDRDYGAVIAAISENATLKAVSDYAGGIKLLRQEPWEALCSFIISQNNNIPRIKGNIDRLCAGFGDDIGGGFYSFPDASAVAAAGVDGLAVLRSGFRAKYIIDAAEKVASGAVDLGELVYLPLDEARARLMTIKGVGPKVADCTLLFGCGRVDSFPVDVWIKRAMQKLFGGELPDCAKPYAGIVQQYIFHYARMTKLQTD